jgi:hypothetical protein
MVAVDSLLFRYIFYPHTSLLVTNNVDMTYYSDPILCNLNPHLLAFVVSRIHIAGAKKVLDTDRPH